MTRISSRFRTENSPKGAILLVCASDHLQVSLRKQSSFIKRSLFPICLATGSPRWNRSQPLRCCTDRRLLRRLSPQLSLWIVQAELISKRTVNQCCERNWIENREAMNKEQRHQKGITLIELIVAVALLSLIFLAVFFILKSSYGFWQMESKSVSLEGQLRSIQDIMLRDLRPCKSATVVQGVSTIQLFFSQTDTVPETTDTSTYFEYNASNQTLYRALAGVKNPLSRPNIVVSPISDIFSVQIVSPSFYFIRVNLVAMEGSEEKELSFSVTTRRPK